MRYHYDPDADALYIELRYGEIDHQHEQSDGVLLDLAADGSLIGVDVMVPGSGWAAEEIISDRHLSRNEGDLLIALARIQTWQPRGSKQGAAVHSVSHGSLAGILVKS